jgi:hypothetical protein
LTLKFPVFAAVALRSSTALDNHYSILSCLPVGWRG